MEARSISWQYSQYEHFGCKNSGMEVQKQCFFFPRFYFHTLKRVIKTVIFNPGSAEHLGVGALLNCTFTATLSKFGLQVCFKISVHMFQGTVKHFGSIKVP